jgi:hypothetical protein
MDRPLSPYPKLLGGMTPSLTPTPKNINITTTKMKGIKEE